jgi:predicted SAM-dependent methyltransferase
VPSKSTYELLGDWDSISEIVASYGSDLKLDLGCGFSKPQGFIGLDNLSGADIQDHSEENGPDIIIDLNTQGIPFPNDSCSVVRASHFLEHSSLDKILYEIHRVLMPAGTLHLILPYANSAEGMYPGHVLFFTERWFEQSRMFRRLFEIHKVEYDESAIWAELPRLLRRIIPFSFARRFLFNACWQMRLEARAIKPNG